MTDRLSELQAGMVELVDTQDLKSCEPKRSYGFDPRSRYNQTLLKYLNYRNLRGVFIFLVKPYRNISPFTSLPP